MKNLKRVLAVAAASALSLGVLAGPAAAVDVGPPFPCGPTDHYKIKTDTFDFSCADGKWKFKGELPLVPSP